MLQPLIADGGELTVLRSLASHAWGQWAVQWPESVPEAQRPKLADDREHGFIYAMDRPVGRMGRRFVRADTTINAADYGPDGVILPHTGTSNVEEQLDAAATRTDGDAFFEREITREGLGPLVPYEDFDVGDIVPVSIWGRVMDQPVMSIEAVSEAGAVIDWRVHVGGELLADDAARRRANEEIERSIAQERRERKKSVNAVDSKATAAHKAADSAQATADVAVKRVSVVEDSTQRALLSADSKSTIFFGSDTPIGGRDGDTWFKDLPSGKVAIVQMINGQWRPRVDTKQIEEDIATTRTAVAKAAQEVTQLHDITLPALDRELDSTTRQVKDLAGTQLPSLRDQVSVLSSGLTTEQQTRTTALQQAKRDLAEAEARLTAPGAVTETMIAAGAITAGKIAAASITGDKLTANTITGDKLTANSISTQHLTIAPGNLFPDPHFRDPSWGSSGNAYAAPDNGGELRFFPDGTHQGRYYQPVGIKDASMMLEPGVAYRLSATVWEDAGGEKAGSISVYLRFKKTIHTTSYQRMGVLPIGGANTSVQSMTFTAPTTMHDGTCTMGFFVQKEANGGTISMWNVQLVRAADASLIVDGAVLAQHVGAGAITAGKIGANAVTTRAIATNSVTTNEIAAGTITEANIKTASVTSDKLVIANGFITKAMIANAAITSAKIAALDAGKITTGVLSADRIGSNTITTRHLAAGAVTATEIAADSITVKELRAGTIVPLGTELIVSEPLTSGSAPVPVWWQAAPSELAATYSGWSRPGGHAWHTTNPQTQRVSTTPPIRLVKVQPGKQYRLRFFARAAAAGSRIYIEARDQLGRHAVQSGAVSGTPVKREQKDDTTIAWVEDYTGSNASSYLVSSWEVPILATQVESLITFKPEVEYVTLGAIYWNHPDGVAVTNQWLAGLSLTLDTVDQDQINAAQDALIRENETRIREIEELSNELSKTQKKLVERRSPVLSTGSDKYFSRTGQILEALGNWTGEVQVLEDSWFPRIVKVPDANGNRIIPLIRHSSAISLLALISQGVMRRFTGELSTSLPYASSTWRAVRGAPSFTSTTAGEHAIKATVQWERAVYLSTYGIRILVGGVVVAQKKETNIGPLIGNTVRTQMVRVPAKQIAAGQKITVEVMATSSESKARWVRSNTLDITWVEES